jgi:SEC-C motif
MSTTGRNEPCPCGSGRKYKQCCGNGKYPSGVLAASSTRDAALAKLLTFAFHPAFDSDHAVAEVMFWGNLIRDSSRQEFEWILDSQDATIKYNTWFLFDWEAEDSGTVAEIFLEEAAAELTPPEREFLQRLSNAPLRLYEVESVEAGEGAHLIDLWTGTRLFVIERTATEEMVAWDLLGARVAPDGMGGNVFEGGLYLYPVESKDEVVQHFRRLYRRHHRKFPLDRASTFFRRYGVVFHHLWVRLVAFPEPPEVVTSDGDPLVFCRSVFDTDEPDTVREILQAQPQVRAAKDGTLGWLETNNEGQREVGAWSIEGKRVLFETNSQERATRGRAWLGALAGDRVRYRATALETIEQTMNELRRRRPKSAAAPAPDEPAVREDGAVRELYDRHYHDWLDRPLLALANRTPRAAARSRIWRRKVIDLLKGLENTSARGALHGRPIYDFQWIWRELELERPGPQQDGS